MAKKHKKGPKCVGPLQIKMFLIGPEINKLFSCDLLHSFSGLEKKAIPGQ
jgi:hypothetical protein